jgi:hypothetical protein
MLRDVNREPLTFCTRRYVYKKYKIDVKGCQSKASCFFVRVGSLTVRVIKSEPLASIRNAYC